MTRLDDEADETYLESDVHPHSGMGDEPPGYPALDLMRTIEERKLDPSRFLLLDIGETRPLRPVQKGT